MAGDTAHALRNLLLHGAVRDVGVGLVRLSLIHIYMGRHSFASLVTLEEGVPIETISKMLGHSNIKTTQIYARVTPKRLFEDMDRFVEATRDLKLIL